jgi:hypothetical protein
VQGEGREDQHRDEGGGGVNSRAEEEDPDGEVALVVGGEAQGAGNTDREGGDDKGGEEKVSPSIREGVGFRSGWPGLATKPADVEEGESEAAEEGAELLEDVGGRQDRTPDFDEGGTEPGDALDGPGVVMGEGVPDRVGPRTDQ